jgi:hypothetical protein
MVKIIKEEPCTAVAQSKLARGLRKRTDPVDVLKKRDLAGPDGTRGAKIDAQANIQAGRLDHARYGTGLLLAELLPIVKNESI